MPLMKTSNPALRDKTFRGLSGGSYGQSGLIDAANRMTLSGTVNKTGVLLICALATAAWTWHLFLQSMDMADVAPLMLLGVFGGFILALVTIFKKEWSPITAPLYALAEGLFLGGSDVSGCRLDLTALGAKDVNFPVRIETDLIEVSHCAWQAALAERRQLIVERCIILCVCLRAG